MQHGKSLKCFSPKNMLMGAVLLALSQLAQASNGITCTQSKTFTNQTCSDLTITGSHSGAYTGIYFSGQNNTSSGDSSGGSGGASSGGDASGWILTKGGNLTISGANLSATGTSSWSDSSEAGYNQWQPPSALTLRYVNLSQVTIDSTSTLTGVFGVSIQGRMTSNLGAEINAFTNNGTIKGQGWSTAQQRVTGSAGLYIEGLSVGNLQSTTHVGTVTNNGTITSDGGYGVLINHGVKVDSFVNTGTIYGKAAGFGINSPWSNVGGNLVGSWVNKGSITSDNTALMFSFGSNEGKLSNFVFSGDSLTQGGGNGVQLRYYAHFYGFVVEDNAKLVGLSGNALVSTLSWSNIFDLYSGGAIVGITTGRSDISTVCSGTSICVKDHALVSGGQNGFYFGAGAVKGTLLVTGTATVQGKTGAGILVNGSASVGSANSTSTPYTGIKLTDHGTVSTISGIASLDTSATINGMLFADQSKLSGGSTAALLIRGGTVNTIASTDTQSQTLSTASSSDNSYCSGAAICVRAGASLTTTSGAASADAIHIGALNGTGATTINGDIRIESGHSLQHGELGYDLGIYGANTKINGDIVFGHGDFTMVNTGTVSGQIHKTGSGELTIANWGITVVPGEDGKRLNAVNPIHVTLDNGATIDVKNVTITQVSDISKVNPVDNITLENSIVLSANGQTSYTSPEAVDISDTLKGLGFGGWYGGKSDPTFHSTYNVGSSAGAIVSQTMANQLFRRDFFLDAALTEAGTGSLYHRKIDGVEGTAFVKPYYSSDTMRVGSGELTGSTQGFLLGINRFVGRHILTTFMGYERSQFDSPYQSSQLNLDAQSWYGGFNTAHLLGSTAHWDLFLKGGLKAAYSSLDLERNLVAVGISQADTTTVSVGANVSLGMNWRVAQDTQIIPMVGLGYSIGKTSSYQLDRTGLINDSYMPNRVHIPYADANVTWFQGYNRILRTFVSGGVRQVFKTEQSSTVQFDKNAISGTYELPGTYGYVNASAVLHMTHHSEIAVGYTGVFDDAGHSNNLTLKYELHY